MEPSLKDVLDWDVYNWAPALEFWETHLPEDLSGKKVLDIGARDGGLTGWLANKGASVVSSDLSPLSDKAHKLFAQLGVQKQVEYQEINATDIPYENEFDIIIFKSVLGGVGSHNRKDLQEKLFTEVFKALKPGGQLLFAENLKASPVHDFARNYFNNWGARWRYPELSEFREFLKPFTNVQVKTTGFFGTFGRSEMQRGLLGRLDRALFNHIVPDRWKYICICTATKP